MIVKFLAALLLLWLAFRAVKYYRRLPRDRRRGLVGRTVLFALAGILLVGVVTGRMHWFGAVVAALLPMLRWGLHTLLRLVPLWLHRTGGKASFSTEHLEVQVTLQTGQISGQVIKGPHNGSRIEHLTGENLQELERYYEERDTKSFYLIRLARKTAHFGGGPTPPSFANPSRAEALQILGLAGDPSREEIIAAHRRLINKLHPDRGGSDFLAARVNQARDILLETK